MTVHLSHDFRNNNMKKIDDSIVKLFNDMLKKGLITTGNLWIERAIDERNDRLPIGIANSRLLTYDQIDRKVLNQGNFN
jgi:hypothetical protein